MVYPKGVTAIREVEVIQAGRHAGLKDTKVAAFSADRTALRFSFPARTLTSPRHLAILVDGASPVFCRSHCHTPRGQSADIHLYPDRR